MLKTVGSPDSRSRLTLPSLHVFPVATLGLVELFIFLLLRYYDLQNKERKDVFAEVHFALFYTAIFNAFQSMLCSFFTRRVSNTLWVQTEHLELDHYVEIREAFDKASEEYDSVKESQQGWNVILRFWHALRQPVLHRRYMNLLVQVRFHELRVQFLENNNLPLTLKVSDYLKRSEESVLMNMVHVSGTAWLMLTGVFNVMYFAEGLVANKTQDPAVVSKSMSGIFFAMLISFIVICILLYFKMRSIFQQILYVSKCLANATCSNLLSHNPLLHLRSKMKYIRPMDSYSGAQSQRRLFWFSEPQVVISLIQFMQFGYATALSIVIMFWSDLGEIAPYWYLLTTLGCYAVFVFVLSRVLPQYTLCTSLGNMVNKEHLNTTLAMHRFDEAQRRQKRRMVQLAFEGDKRDDSIVRLITGDGIASVNHPSASSNLDKSCSPLLQEPHCNDEFSMPKASSGASGYVMPREGDEDLTSSLLAELVKMDTSALRSQLSAHDQTRLEDRQQRKSNRKKAASDGVQAMRGMGQLSMAAVNLFSGPEIVVSATKSIDDTETTRLARLDRLAFRRENRKKSLSASGLIQAWQQADEPQKPPGHNRNLSVIDEDREREHRRKSSSASEVIKLWQGSGSMEGNDVGPKFVLKENFLKTSDEPAVFHRQLKNQSLKERTSSRRKAASASDVIRSWRDLSVIELSSSNGLKATGKQLHHEKDGDEQEKAPIFTVSSGDLGMDTDEIVTVVNLSDASLVKGTTSNAPRTKKSVGFSNDSDFSAEANGNPGQYFEDDDDATADTGASIGELSDVGVPLLECESLRSVHHWQEPWRAKLSKKCSPDNIKKWLRNFFTSDTYGVVSHVFGSVVIFLLIGMRLETFNALFGAYDTSENTWVLELNVAFWWQATWYMLFIIVSGLAMWAINPSECASIAEKSAFLTALVDFLLSCLCVTLLFVADAQRCCEADSEIDGLARLLKGDSEVGEPGTDSDYKECCPFWGSRTHGGYGSIEPCTALIGLRVLRFHFAKIVIQHQSSKENRSIVEENVSDEHGQMHGDDVQSAGRGHGSDKEKMVEIWQRAINQHPHIVEQYGHLSAELFQVMLGLDAFDDANLKTKADISVIQTSTPVADEQRISEQTDDTPHYKLGKRYSNLSTECQGIILAGKLGKPVKSLSNLLLDAQPGDDNLPTHEGTIVEGRPTRVPDVEFKVDTKQLAEEQNSDSIFIAPNATLTRSMRRCERRLEPLLMEWITVDVVMTDIELVYFEVTEGDHATHYPEVGETKEALQKALQVTRGGKGLRLIDVAAGRKVVGHLDLSDITHINVERDMPYADTSHFHGHFDASNQLISEFWQKTTHIEAKTESRALRWARVKEDRLKVVSRHGTLYLRYLSDLDEVEAHPEESMAEDELAGFLKKTIAFQWAQTLVHICGKDQLKQQFPNHGTNDSEELRDYLEVVHHRSDETKGHRRRRTSTFGLPTSMSHRDLRNLPGSLNSSRHLSSGFLRRDSSVGGAEGNLTEKPKSLGFSQRSATTGGNRGQTIKLNSGRQLGSGFHRRHSSFGGEEGSIPEKPKSLGFTQRSASIGDRRHVSQPHHAHDIEAGNHGRATNALEKTASLRLFRRAFSYGDLRSDNPHPMESIEGDEQSESASGDEIIA
jgi:Mlo family